MAVDQPQPKPSAPVAAGLNGATPPTTPRVAVTVAKPAVGASPTAKPPAKPAIALPLAITPLRADESTAPEFLRLLVLGFSKIGKSTCVICTAPKPVFVINCDQPESLEPVKRYDRSFLHYYISNSKQLEQCLEAARQMLKTGEIKTVVWDTLSGYSPILESEAFQATLTFEGNEDGRRASPLYRKYLRNYVKRFLSLKGHTICISHYLDVNGKGEEDEDPKGRGDREKKSELSKVPKSGPGVVPLLYGAARVEIGAFFQDVVFMEKRGHGSGETREFVTGINGVYGPGCRSFSTNRAMPADIQHFIAEAKKEASLPIRPLNLGSPTGIRK